jgi:hypothetical protein
MTGAAVLPNLNLWCDAETILHTASGRAIGTINGPVAYEIKLKDASPVVECRTEAAPLSKRNIRAGEEETSISRYSNSGVPTRMRAATPTFLEMARSLCTTYYHDDIDGNHNNVVGVGEAQAPAGPVRQKFVAAKGDLGDGHGINTLSLNASASSITITSTSMSTVYLLCSFVLFSLILWCGGCTLKVGSKIEKTKRTAMRAGRLGGLGKILLGLSLLASLVAAEEGGANR